MYGMKKIASSQAVAVCGLRLRGTKMTARTRMTKSTTTARPARTRMTSAGRATYRKFTNCSATSRSLPLSSAMVACRSSRLFGLHPQLVALDLALHALGRLVADDLADLLRVVAGDALLQAGLDAVLLAAGERLAGVEGLRSEMPRLISFCSNTSSTAFTRSSAFAFMQDLLAAELDRGADVLEVVALGDLLLRLVQGVLDLHLVDLAHDVEGGICHSAMIGIGAPMGRVSGQ